MGTLKYRFKGDRPVFLGETLVKPGDSYEADDPINHGEFEPANQAAKDAAAAIAQADAALLVEDLRLRGIVDSDRIAAELGSRGLPPVAQPSAAPAPAKEA